MTTFLVRIFSTLDHMFIFKDADKWFALSLAFTDYHCRELDLLRRVQHTSHNHFSFSSLLSHCNPAPCRKDTLTLLRVPMKEQPDTLKHHLPLSPDTLKHHLPLSPDTLKHYLPLSPETLKHHLPLSLKPEV